MSLDRYQGKSVKLFKDNNVKMFQDNNATKLQKKLLQIQKKVKKQDLQKKLLQEKKLLRIQKKVFTKSPEDSF